MVSRRSMLIRDRKLPPRTSFADPSASTAPFGSTGVTCPAKITDCGDWGRSTRTMRGLVRRAGMAALCPPVAARPLLLPSPVLPLDPAMRNSCKDR